MLIVIPAEVQVFLPFRPWMNWVLLGLTCLVSGFFLVAPVAEETVDLWVLYPGVWTGFWGHLLIHGDWMHLIGNMVFLWVFGNAVASTLKPWAYLLLYLLCGSASALLHLGFDGDPAVGASGAINGIIGFYLALYPRNPITCWYLFFIKAGEFEMKGMWLVGIWFLLDVLGVLTGDVGVAYWGHIGGFVMGLSLGLAALKMRFVVLTAFDHPSLWEMLTQTTLARQSPDQLMGIPQVVEATWLVSNQGNQLGPYTLAVILDLRSKHILRDEDWVWMETEQKWVSLSDFLLGAYPPTI
jgi:membrane associated rhomboid family serine protease